jgi:activator of HSP90 ATPase
MQRINEKVTRRKMSWMLGGVGMASAQAQTKQPSTAIHQEIEFKAAPARIYEVLLDAKQFSALTKDAAEIQPQAGATFKLFGGRIEGRNVELAPNQRIVQAWRPSAWPPGVYSIVKFELVARGSETTLILDHAGFTADNWESLYEGWQSHYWGPLRKYLL